MVCPTCQTTWKGDQVIGEIFGRHTMRGWAELIYLYFARLGHNADIYLKHSPKDIRSVALAEKEKSRGGELLTGARKRAQHVYPLFHFIKDCSAGGDPLRRIYAFLTA
jgi:hypothetical protein